MSTRSTWSTILDDPDRDPVGTARDPTAPVEWQTPVTDARKWRDSALRQIEGN